MPSAQIRLAVLAVVTAFAIGLLQAPATFAAAAIDPYVVSPDPTEDETVTVTVTGTTDAATNLHVFQRLNSQECMSPNIEYNRITAASGTPIPAGPFSVPVTFTPATAGAYRVCAYASASVYSTPLATRSELITVRLPFAVIDPIQVSPDPTEDEAVTLTLTGTSEAARSLFAYQRLNSQPCMPPHLEYNRMTPTTGVPVGPGPFSTSLEFTPAAAGAYRICAFVAENAYVTPLATGTLHVEVRRAHATVAVTPVVPYLLGSTATAALVGVAEHSDVKLAWKLMSGAAECQFEYFDTGASIPSGDFSVPVNLSFTQATVHTLCARLSDTNGRPADFSQVFTKAPGTLTPIGPRGTAGARSGSPVFSWSYASWPDPIGVTLSVSTGAQLDANGHLRNPILRATDRFDLGSGRGTYAPGKPLPAGAYFWHLSWYEDGIGAGHTNPIRFRVPPIRMAAAGRVDMSRSTARTARFRFRVRDNVRGSRVRIIVKRGARVLAIKKYRPAAILRSSARTATFRLGRRVSSGQRLTFIVEVRDRFGVSRDTVRARVPALRAPARPAGPSGGGGGNCHPSYAGACLQQGIGDYDCAGGSGNGPNYVSGPIRVVGADEFDLDRDGDGIACES